MASTPTDTGDDLPGGFVIPPPPQLNQNRVLPSPAPSTASARAAAGLPVPRSKPLLPGSRKEDYARDYVSQRLLHISRRYVKKFGLPDPADELTGYQSFGETCRDLEEVVDVLWFSGTPSLQIPNLLTVALAMNTYLPAFPPEPRPTFSLLKKLDHCIASLLQGHDFRTGAPLPGFQRGLIAGFSATDMVRIKSIADETRVLVAMIMSGEADVKDGMFDDDGDAGNSKRARRPSEPRDAAVALAGSSTPKPRAPAADTLEDRIKREEQDETEDEDDGTEFVDVADAPAVPKRKRTVSPTFSPPEDDTALSTDGLNDSPKRVKVEEGHGSMAHIASIMAPAAGGEAHDADGPPGRSGPGQFHFSLDEDNDSSDEEATRVSTQNAAPAAQIDTQATQTESDDASNDASDDDDDEEEEEFQMNVAKVYEKTLVQLGKTLGESLIDDP